MKSSPSSQKRIAGNIQHHLPTAVSGQLDTPGRYRVFNRFLLRTSKAAHNRTKKEEKALDREIADLIANKAVEEVDFCQARLVSPMFIVPKKGEKRRPVLQSMNQCQQGAFQVGGYQKPQRHPTSRRLHGEIGPQRSLFLGFDCLSKQEVPTVPLEGQASPIHMLSLWTQQRPVCLHKAASPSSSLCERTGSLLPHAHRWHVDPRRDQRGAELQFSLLPVSDDLTWVHREQ